VLLKKLPCLKSAYHNFL